MERIPTPARVLHVITRLELGGAQRNTLYTVANLDSGLFEAALAWGPGDRLDSEALDIKRVTLYPIDELVRAVQPVQDVCALRALRRCMREFKPNIVHTHSSKAGVLGRLAARLEGVKITVHSIHGYGFTPVQPLLVRALFLAVEKAIARLTSHFIVVSRPNKELGLKLGLFEADEVSLIRSGIDLHQRATDKERDLFLREIGLPPEAVVVTQVGNFKPQKAPLDFVRVAAQIHENLPDVWYVMAGDGPLRTEAEELARRLGIARRMRFCGWRDDVRTILAASRLTVLTSRHEGLPRSVLESLACGVPVVATRVDGTAEIVEDGVTGVLAEVGDIDELAAGVLDLLQHEDKRKRFASGSSTGLDEFDINLMVRRQEELYGWLLSRNL
ncbi:MAG: glycosyltransferase family 4 protein [bacterium]|nr:glycosyltransferase family 4 protein [bacterium]